MLLDFKTYYKATIIKIARDQHKDRHTDQWKEIPEINPCMYSQMIFNKAAKTIQWKKNSLFNKFCWENGITSMRENEEGPLHHIQKFTKNGPNTNGRAKTAKSLEEKK